MPWVAEILLFLEDSFPLETDLYSIPSFLSEISFNNESSSCIVISSEAISPT